MSTSSFRASSALRGASLCALALLLSWCTQGVTAPAVPAALPGSVEALAAQPSERAREPEPGSARLR
jgi:hypothetical protein